MNWPSSSLLIEFSLNSNLLHFRIATPACFLGPLVNSQRSHLHLIYITKWFNKVSVHKIMKVLISLNLIESIELEEGCPQLCHFLHITQFWFYEMPQCQVEATKASRVMIEATIRDSKYSYCCLSLCAYSLESDLDQNFDEKWGSRFVLLWPTAILYRW